MIINRAVAVLAVLALLTGCGGGGGGGGAASPHRAAGPAPTPVAAENTRPGTKDWKVRKPGAEHAIEGFADRVSVLPGESFRLFVSTTAKGYTVSAFRMGWYAGAEARKVWAAPHQAGLRQAGAKTAGKTHTVTAPWKPSLTVSTRDWPEGSYLLRLDADSGAQRFVPITVRSPSTAGKVVVLGGTTTWQAYNMWGGRDLYQGPGGFDGRSRAVSFDRPYDGNGAVKFLAFEQPAVALAEKTGLPLAYETDNDLHHDPRLLDGARTLVTLGHDEYWSTAMRDEATKARDAGMNIAFLGANAVNRHVRFESTSLGADRLVVCYKSADEDPIKDPAEKTQDWRLSPKPRPESALIGIMYTCFPADGAWKVYRPDDWVFAGTGVRKGDEFPGVIGPESDAVTRGGPTPRPIEVLAHSTVECGTSTTTSDSTYYTARSGAGVFATGTMRWVCAMRGRACGHGVTGKAASFVAKVTENVLRAFAAGPAGRAHPVHDNLAKIKPAGAGMAQGADLD
ncbi:hypothetical protein NE236_11645 [Actinoallomurus purpureus]|uniref:N,N-dimethylformamidase beta subunit family domain-containing protein n=1 Tax=Actinoallomurus purpureus TaxID=478114 RepID=UPI00209326F9|nr:N,N-dimethylformamidase beta subunit family domain-containing protein [Actinoallomurus purpureus]MCO6005635.1 hypothetical protein [Actinoallomurus purpureus]